MDSPRFSNELVDVVQSCGAKGNKKVMRNLILLPLKLLTFMCKSEAAFHIPVVASRKCLHARVDKLNVVFVVA